MDVVAKEIEQCEHCKTAARGLFVQMLPGKDKVPWWLCFRCWLDGIRPMAKNEVVQQPVKSAPKKRKAS